MLDLMEILGLRSDAGWRRDAACTPGDTGRLDPIVGGEPTRGELAMYRRAAAELCAGCPVARLCAAEADLHADEGVRGGSLRYRAGGPHGTYTVERLIPEAVPSIHEDTVAERLARKRALVEKVCAALVEGNHRAAHLYWHLSDTKDETYGVK